MQSPLYNPAWITLLIYSNSGNRKISRQATFWKLATLAELPVEMVLQSVHLWLKLALGNTGGGGYDGVGVCNGTTKAKQNCATENAKPHVGCTINVALYGTNGVSS